MPISAEDAAMLAQAFREWLDAAPRYGREADELLKAFSRLAHSYFVEDYVACVRALMRAQELLPSSTFLELNAAATDIQVRLAPTVTELAAMDNVPAARRAIAVLEHTIDDVRALTARIDNLLATSSA